MALSPNSYGSVAGVAVYVARLTTDGGSFTASTRPTLAQVEGFLDQQSAVLNGWIAQAGYNVPITQSDAALILARYANIGAAGLVELTQAAAGYASDGEDSRENRFLSEFARAEAWIKSGALAALGVGQNTVGPGLSGLSVGGRSATGAQLKPIFTRTSFGNNPSGERGSREP